MHSDPHFQLFKINDFSHFLNDFDHGKPHVDDILRLNCWISIFNVNKSENDIAVSNSVELVNIEFQAAFVEISKEVAEHHDNLFGIPVGGVGCKACDVCVKYSDILELVGELKSYGGIIEKLAYDMLGEEVHE